MGSFENTAETAYVESRKQPDDALAVSIDTAVRVSDEMPCRHRSFCHESVETALRAAADWIEVEYGESNPHALTVEWNEDSGWSVGVVLGW